MTAAKDHLGAHRIGLDPCRVLLLGEDNPQSADPRYALWNQPEGCAGHRLEHILGLEGITRRYVGLWRTNLCCPRWSVAQARERAQVILDPSAGSPWSVVVALGAKVRDAIGFPGAFFTTACVDKRSWYALGENPPSDRPGMLVVSIPHPSGRNLVWNDPRQAERARMIMRAVAPEIYA